MSIWRRETTFEAPQRSKAEQRPIPPLGQLVSLGWQDYSMSETNPRTQAVVVRETRYRILYDPRHTSRRYIQWQSGPVEPLDHHIGQTTTVRPIGTIRTRGFTSGRHSPGEPDRRVVLDEFNG